jgi:hypothetical protein
MHVQKTTKMLVIKHLMCQNIVVGVFKTTLRIEDSPCLDLRIDQ